MTKFFNNKNILVTGGSGYFGSILVDILNNYKANVSVFDINQPENKNVKYIKGDIRDYKTVVNATKNIDIVLHNVAQVPLAKNKKLFNSVNIDGTNILLKASYENKVNKIVYTSSSAIFGIPEKNPVDENTIPKPMEDYGKAKYEAEKLCLKYISKGLNISIVRPRTILGKGRLGIFQILFEWIKTGQNIPIFNSGNNIYQFIHADDLAEIILRASEEKNSEIYNAGATEFCTMKETLNELIKHSKSSSKIKSLPMLPFEILMNIFSFLRLSPLSAYHSLMYGRSLYFNNEKVIKKLNYKTKYNNITAIKDSYDWYILNYKGIEENLSPHKSGINQKILKFLKFFI